MISQALETPLQLSRFVHEGGVKETHEVNVHIISSGEHIARGSNNATGTLGRGYLKFLSTCEKTEQPLQKFLKLLL